MQILQNHGKRSTIRILTNKPYELNNNHTANSPKN